MKSVLIDGLGVIIKIEIRILHHEKHEKHEKDKIGRASCRERV